MSSSDEVTVAPPAVPSRGSQKMLQLLRKRLRQLAWITLVLTLLLALVAGIFGIWWLNSLNGLPDIGDPFDVAAFQRFQIPDEQNAFTFLRRANQKLTPLPDLPQKVRDTQRRSAGRRPLRGSAHGSRRMDQRSHCFRMLPINRMGSYRGSAGVTFLNTGMSSPTSWLGWRSWKARGGRNAVIRPARWDCYRAMLRVSTHFRRRGSMIERTIANRLFAQVKPRLESWSADRRTAVPLLRQALDEAITTQPRPEWDAFSLKLDYLFIMRMLEQPRHDEVANSMRDDFDYRLGSYQLPPDLAVYVFIAHHFASREPERSRRATRLVFANWLGHVEDPAMRTKPPAVRVYARSGRIGLLLYPVSPQRRPAPARSPLRNSRAGSSRPGTPTRS